MKGCCCQTGAGVWKEFWILFWMWSTCWHSSLIYYPVPCYSCLTTTFTLSFFVLVLHICLFEKRRRDPFKEKKSCFPSQPVYRLTSAPIKNEDKNENAKTDSSAHSAVIFDSQTSILPLLMLLTLWSKVQITECCKSIGCREERKISSIFRLTVSLDFDGCISFEDECES